MATKKSDSAKSTKKAPSVLTLVPSNMESLVSITPGGLDLSRFQKKTLARIIKPAELPEGGGISGILNRIIEVQATATKKGKVIILSDPENPNNEVGFPCTTVVARALEINETEGDLASKYIGKAVAIVSGGKQPGGQGGNGFWLYEVYVEKDKEIKSAK